MDTYIYLDSDSCRWHLDQLEITINRTTDIIEFLNYQSKRKVGMFHVPYPYNADFEERINLVIDHCDVIIIMCSELHNESADFILKYDNLKIKYFICGFLNQELLNSTVSIWMDWFITTSYFYKYTPTLDYLNPHQVKDKYFDILLGQPKLHRGYIFKKIQSFSDSFGLNTVYDFNSYLQDLLKSQLEGYDLSEMQDEDFKHLGGPIILAIYKH